MSTASRNCGTVCSARGLGSNAPEVPGVSGKIRRHYDLRAARQLGSLKKTGPKCEPEAEIAAHASQGSAQKTTLPRRGARLRHSPPLFLPQPPPIRRRRDMMNDHRRETPLADCPNLTCRRAGICHHLADRGNCLKTNFANHDDWCDYMAAKIRRRKTSGAAFVSSLASCRHSFIQSNSCSRWGRPVPAHESRNNAHEKV